MQIWWKYCLFKSGYFKWKFDFLNNDVSHTDKYGTHPSSLEIESRLSKLFKRVFILQFNLKSFNKIANVGGIAHFHHKPERREGNFAKRCLIVHFRNFYLSKVDLLNVNYIQKNK